MSERAARARAAADGWAEVWADATPRRVDIHCPNCGRIDTEFVFPPLLVQLAAGYEFDPDPIVEGTVIECRFCILYRPASA